MLIMRVERHILLCLSVHVARTANTSSVAFGLATHEVLSLAGGTVAMSLHAETAAPAFAER